MWATKADKTIQSLPLCLFYALPRAYYQINPDHVCLGVETN